MVKRSIVIELILDRENVMILLFLAFDRLYLLFVSCNCILLFSDEVTEFHLFFD